MKRTYEKPEFAKRETLQAITAVICLVSPFLGQDLC
jgi:hypothetical protein